MDKCYSPSDRLNWFDESFKVRHAEQDAWFEFCHDPELDYLLESS